MDRTLHKIATFSLWHYIIGNSIYSFRFVVKVHIFWEGHKILQNLHLTFDCVYCSQMKGGDFAKFCGLLRIYELYLQSTLQDWATVSCVMTFCPKVSQKWATLATLHKLSLFTETKIFTKVSSFQEDSFEILMLSFLLTSKQSQWKWLHFWKKWGLRNCLLKMNGL